MNSRSFIWEVENSPYSSDFLKSSNAFGKNNPIVLIDQYSGKRPSLINQDFLTIGAINISMYASALLDSSLLDLLDKVVQKGRTTDGLRDFLVF
jgi:hypothetical protein